MRLICTIFPEESAEDPVAFSNYLTNQGIENTCEEVEAAEKVQYRIWVYDEDQVEQALALYETYKKNPKEARSKQTMDTPFLQQTPQPQRRKGVLARAPYGPISILTITITIALFLWAQVERGDIIPPKIPGVIQAPVLAPIERDLIFDYPLYFQLRDTFLTLYTKKDFEENAPLNEQQQDLLQTLSVTPTWMGLYDRIVFFFQHKPTPASYKGPLFEDIRHGEVWRLFTPAVLHFDFLHIFFNLLWFILLANQIEHRVGSLRFGLMLLVTGMTSNLAQYLMSGPFFMGLSGIVVGMAAFIWARQQVAPWEGYLLHRFTLIFLASFVVGMFVLQVIFFFMQIWGQFDVTIGIANAAHLVGGAAGYLLGRMRRFFSIHKKRLS